MKEQDNTLETLFLKPREYSDDDRRNTHNTRELTPIWDMASTLYKLQRENDLRKGKITSLPTKGNSKYHR
jgi:hypothetical protein